MSFKAKEKGYEITMVFSGVENSILENYELIKNTSLKALSEAKFNILGTVDHKFTPQGYTFVVLLAESHLAVHTYPEYNSIYFHLYTCGDKDETSIVNLFKEVFKPKNFTIRKEDVFIKF